MGIGCAISLHFSDTDGSRACSVECAMAGKGGSAISSLPSGVVDSELVKEGVRWTWCSDDRRGGGDMTDATAAVDIAGGAQRAAGDGDGESDGGGGRG